VGKKISWIQFRVEDNGPGIPKDEQINLFEKFSQASSIQQAELRGTGLGLTIAKEIVELHGGVMSVESEEGRGSCFFFDLPLHQAETEVVEKDKEDQKSEEKELTTARRQEGKQRKAS